MSVMLSVEGPPGGCCQHKKVTWRAVDLAQGHKHLPDKCDVMSTANKTNKQKKETWGSGGREFFSVVAVSSAVTVGAPEGAC